MAEEMIKISVRNLVEFILREEILTTEKELAQTKKPCSLEVKYIGKSSVRWGQTIWQKLVSKW